MPPIPFTSQQRLAIETTGRSVIVSAAAGSGKTAVLAERCAYLVCDIPPPQRHNIDELLVLTFTDAAAAQMRSRIAEAIRARFAAQPRSERLAEQVALVDVAQISTIHSFCLWLVRRWFSDLGIDPAATILDQDEMTLLKSDVLDDVFSRLYGVERAPEDRLGDLEPSGAGKDRVPSERVDFEPEGACARAFVRLVDDYGLGSDRSLARLVLKLFEFTASLPDPAGWLRDAVDSIAHRPRGIVLDTLVSLRAELSMQVEHCEHLVTALRKRDTAGSFHADQIQVYLEQLVSWATMLDELPKAVKRSDEDGQGLGLSAREVDQILAVYQDVIQQIAAFEFGRARGPRLPKDSDPADVKARERAAAMLSDVKKRLFGRRLAKRFGLFSIEQWLEGLGQVAPYVSTIVDLVVRFRDAYTERKRRLNVLDFSDLERLAFDLLCSEEDPSQPTEIARLLQRRFAHVLVDEFQDINPIQQAIIRLVSREPDPDQPNNLFVVGDVKQSIYRFRLAEPAIFARRLSAAREGKDDHVGTGRLAAIALQSNFRSRPPILDAVNHVFGRLMRPGVGDIAYDDEATLRPGRHPPIGGDPAASESHARHPATAGVELHLLERAWPGPEQDDEAVEPGFVDLHDPARWTSIEREAFLIGSRIRAWMQGSEPSPTGEPLRYRDVAVLLRAAAVNAERIAAMLAQMGINAFADVGGSLFAALEVRDVLASLQVLDNSQQDIPLTSVLRSGIFGEPLNEKDLVEIRRLNRDVPFHEAVRQYAERGHGGALRDRLGHLMERMSRFRNEVRRRPLADVLWGLYQRQGYLAHVGGLPGGCQRRANLLKLHELARKFGSFRRQGLHRFLSFIQSLSDVRQTIASAPAIGESEDVVRIMSIHQSKGLEFPVVFIAGLGTKFNLQDRSGSMIFERKAKIGLRVVDTQRMIEYPSASHHLVADEIESATRREELRILYVAMTRARDKLVLIGSKRDIAAHRETPQPAPAPAPSCLEITTAAAPLDWLMPAIGGQSLFDVSFHDVEEMAAWRTTRRASRTDNLLLKAVSRRRPLPSDEPLADSDERVERVLARIDYTYPSLASASIRAVVAAGEFKGAYDYTHDPDQRQGGRDRGEAFGVPPSKYTPRRDGEGAGGGAHRGIITHRVLQHLDFAAAMDAAGVASELQRMQAKGLLIADDRSLVDEPSLVWFVSTPTADAIRKAGSAYRREFQFIATQSPDYFDPSVGPLPGDEVLVRGIVDGILPVGVGSRRLALGDRRLAAIEIVDFKTDRVRPEDVASRAETYRPQMELYARAMSHLFRKPVLACRLVFLGARETVRWDDLAPVS